VFGSAVVEVCSVLIDEIESFKTSPADWETLNMEKTAFFSVATVTIILIAGCIVCDELTTITIRPDGSADWIRFQSNIRSTEKGEKGAQELRTFVAEFDAHTDSESVRVSEAGGELVESRWVRRSEPYATLVTARFPKASALENFFTIKDEKGRVLAQPHFTQAGNKRKLSITIPVPRDETPKSKSPPSWTEWRERQANGISETRLVVAGGYIIATQGFVVSSDKRSCLLDSAQVEKLLSSQPEHAELFVEWELADN